jgi:hypothetical protein
MIQRLKFIIDSRWLGLLLSGSKLKAWDWCPSPQKGKKEQERERETEKQRETERKRQTEATKDKCYIIQKYNVCKYIIYTFMGVCVYTCMHMHKCHLHLKIHVSTLTQKYSWSLGFTYLKYVDKILKKKIFSHYQWTL